MSLTETRGGGDWFFKTSIYMTLQITNMYFETLAHLARAIPVSVGFLQTILEDIKNMCPEDWTMQAES